jgi:hypothetical protein
VRASTAAARAVIFGVTTREGSVSGRPVSAVTGACRVHDAIATEPIFSADRAPSSDACEPSDRAFDSRWGR